MPLLFLQQWFSDEVLKATGWTLIHSLWQGLLAAVLAGIVIIFTKKSAARLRYNLLGVVLILFVATAIITFYQQIKNGTASEKAFASTAISVTEISFTDVNYEAAPLPALTAIDKFIGYFNTNAELFVLIWALFFFVHCIKLIGGLAGIQRLRNYRTHSSPDEWLEKLDHLSQLIGIKQSVSLLQSELVKVPAAIGFFKPVILVPLGLLSNLPPEQVETILLHELAHIRRKDYVVNIMQRFAEAVFFFNPALLWISSLVRQEREACCDDVVVANTSHKGNYLEALVSFQEYSLANSGYVMAIGSKRHYLLNRVKRMITSENKKLNSMEKILLMVGLVAITAFTFIPKEKANDKKKDLVTITSPGQQPEITKPTTHTTLSKSTHPVKHVIKEENLSSAVTNNKPVLEVSVVTPPIDTVPEKKRKDKTTSYDDLKIHGMSSSVHDDGKTKTENITVTDQDGKKYSYTKLNNKLTSLSIDGKTIPENEFGNYSELLDQIEMTMQENRARRLQQMELRKVERARRTEDVRNRLVERNLTRQYLNAQRQYLLQQDRQSKVLERSRRTMENQRRETMRLLERLRERRMNVPTLNGREIIKNNIPVDHPNAAALLVKAEINTIKAAALNKKVQPNMVKQAVLVKNINLKAGVNRRPLKSLEYKNNNERSLLNQHVEVRTIKLSAPVKQSLNIEPSTKTPPIYPHKVFAVLKRRVTT